MAVPNVTFYLRGDSLTARYARGDNRHALGLQASGPSPSKVISVISDGAAIGGQTINMGNPAASIALLYSGRENCPNTQRFTAIARCKIFSANGAVGLWGMGSFGLLGAPNFSSGVFAGGFRTRAMTSFGFNPINTADLSHAASPPNLTGASYNDIVWKYSRASGAGACQIFVNGTSIGTYTAANAYELPIDNKAWSTISFGMNSVFNSNDIYLNEFALIEGDIDVASIELTTGNGALNGSSRSAYLNIDSYSGISWPTVGKTRNDQTWNEYAVAKTGTLVLPSAGNVKSGTAYGDAGTGSTGTLVSTDPGVSNVKTGVGYTIESSAKVGTHVEAVSTDPGEENVALGIDYTINDADKTGTLFLGAFYDTLRGFLNYILEFIGSTSLTNDEFNAIVLVNPEFEYNLETYQALVAVLDSREDISDARDRLKSMFESAGVVTEEPVLPETDSEIVMGGGVEDADSTNEGYTNVLFGGSVDD